jgi:hypothetical protein
MFQRRGRYWGALLHYNVQTFISSATAPLDSGDPGYHHHLPSRFRPTACSGSEVYESTWTFGRTPWTGDQPDARPLPTQDNTIQKKRGHTSMPRAGFEPAIPMFERPKTVLARSMIIRCISEIVSRHLEADSQNFLEIRVKWTNFLGKIGLSWHAHYQKVTICYDAHISTLVKWCLHY